MKRTFMAGACALAFALAATPSLADPNGSYIAGDIGYHWPEEFDGELTSGAFAAPLDVELEGGWAGFVRYGWRFNEMFRLEGEIGYRSGNVEAIAGTTLAGEVDANATSLMANAIFDFGSRNARVRPFVGLGAGMAKVEFDDGTDEIDDSSFAWQALAGLAWSMGPRTNLDVTYRYFNAGDIAFDDGVTALEGDYSDHSITVGLRYSFGAIAAPPPPPRAATSRR